MMRGTRKYPTCQERGRIPESRECEELRELRSKQTAPRPAPAAPASLHTHGIPNVCGPGNATQEYTFVQGSKREYAREDARIPVSFEVDRTRDLLKYFHCFSVVANGVRRARAVKCAAIARPITT